MFQFSKEPLKNQLEEMKEEIRKISKTMQMERLEWRMYASKIEKAEVCEKDRYLEKQARLEKSIQDHEEKKARLQKEYDQGYDQMLKDLQEEYQNYVKQEMDDDVFVASWQDYQDGVALMDAYAQSTKAFLKIEHQFVKGTNSISLYITHQIPDVYVHPSKISLSTLKAYKEHEIETIDVDSLTILQKQIQDHLCEGISCFTYPIQIQGQLCMDRLQSDQAWVCGKTSDASIYGHVREFMIVGICVEERKG